MFLRELIINNKIIGPDQKPFFVAEAGLNHNGDIEIAKKMIDQAISSGADAIKFQTYKSEEFLTESSEYFDFFKNVELSFEQFKELSEYAKNKNFIFFSAPFDIPSANFLHGIDVPCFKIASSDLTNMPLIKHVAAMQKPMIISTGIGTLQEIEDAVNWCMLEGNDQIAILHCVANYPTSPNEVNMNSMLQMKKLFDFPIGYSDNGESLLVDIVAATMGAQIIEKHFTLDKTMPGPDHAFSIEPSELKSLISQIEEIYKIKGTFSKTPQLSEVKNRNAIRKSLTAKHDLKEGQIITQNDILIKRPAGGIEPKYFPKILSKKLKTNIQKDSQIFWSDFE